MQGNILVIMGFLLFCEIFSLYKENWHNLFQPADFDNGEYK
ncbi:hypothetical protein BN1221_03983 [Brenneria goodwinii]|uniref:Uncharacterized protein n=1 Tax=Brenneria goodwinii TaxID=1109412 RepID=A0A0G4K020_9GAMM|nr:hypothetical protein BN1221_03983 [Brenneria goodwinii]